MSRSTLGFILFVSAFVSMAAAVCVCGCAGPASSSTPAMRLGVVREVFPSATEIAEIATDGEDEVSARSSSSVVREVRGPSGLLGHLVETQVSGRSGPFSIAVLLDKQRIVRRAAVTSYPWPRGREVARRSFARQFEGKGPEDAIEVGSDIDAVSGATISCRAMAQGVREAVSLLAE